MNDQPRSDVPSGLPEGPPWSVDTLADIHAGVYPPAMTAILRHQIMMDPEAAAVLKALDSLTADLQDLSPIPSEAGNESRTSVPDIALPPMPAEFAGRLDEALSAEVNARFANRTTQPVWPVQRAAAPSAHRSGQPHEQNRPSEPTPVVGPPSWQTSNSSDNAVSPNAVSPNVVSLEAARRKRRTTWMTAIGGVAAAAVIGTVVVIGISGNQTGGSADSAAAPPAQSAPAAAGSAAATEAPDDEGDAAAENEPEPAPATTQESSAAAEATSGPTQPAPSASRFPTSTSTSPNSTSSAGSSLPATAPGDAAPEFEIDLLVLDPETVADAYDKIAGRNIEISESGDTAVMDNPDLGPISDPEVYDGCVRANGVGNDVLVGLRMAIYQGQIGYAIALDDPFNPTLSTILVVGADCGPDNADLLVRVPAQR